MIDIVQETITTERSNSNPVYNTVTQQKTLKSSISNTQSIEYLLYFIFGVLEVLLIFRLLFKFTGANDVSGFVRSIYNITAIFILPFEGIFKRFYSQGIETGSVLEPSTILAILVYAVVAWGLGMLLKILFGTNQHTS